MPLYDDFADARAVSPAIIGAIQLSKTTGTHVGVTPTLITRPAGVRLLTLRCESGTIRFRPDDYTKGTETFVPNLIVDANDTVNVVQTHSYETGDGPVQITGQQAAMVPLTSIVIDDGANSFVRTVGHWRNEGFWLGGIITVAGSSDNEGDHTISSLTGDGLTLIVSTDITVAEGAQTDLTITAPVIFPTGLAALTNYWVIDAGSNLLSMATSRANALAGTKVAFTRTGNGLFTVGGPAGWAPSDVLTLNKTDGYGSVAIIAGEQITIAAPAELTIVGLAASDACSYWFGR